MKAVKIKGNRENDMVVNKVVKEEKNVVERGIKEKAKNKM